MAACLVHASSEDEVLEELNKRGISSLEDFKLLSIAPIDSESAQLQFQFEDTKEDRKLN